MTFPGVGTYPAPGAVDATDLEQLVLDPDELYGPSLTIQSSDVFHLETFDPGFPPRRPTWSAGAEQDGALLVEDPHYDDAQGSLQLRIMVTSDGDMDAALRYLGDLIHKLAECSAAGPEGMPVLWTPAQASASVGKTMWWKLAELDGAPPIEPQGELAGWLQAKPVVRVRFTRGPACLGPENGTVVEDFATNVIADFVADAGATSNVAIAADVMQAAANYSTENRLIRTAGVDYPDQYDSQDTVNFRVGTTVSGFKAGVVVKRIASDSFVEVYVDDNGTNSRLRVDVVTGGTRANRQSTNLASRLSTSTAYWVRARVEGSTVYPEFWTAPPTPTGAATNAPAGYTLSGPEIPTFGRGVAGKRGVTLLPMQSSAWINEWVIEPNLWITSAPLLTGTLPGVPGDLDAVTRLVFTDLANQARRFIDFGLEQRYYQELPLLFDSSSLTTTGFAGSSATRTGSYGANVVRSPGLSDRPTAIAGLLNQGHVGTFRVMLRCYPSSTDIRVRLSWADGAGAYRSNDYTAVPGGGAFADVDLGVITIEPTAAGWQVWSARIEALSATADDTIDFDLIELVPAGEGYGKLRGSYSYTPGAIIRRDEFANAVDLDPLNGRTAPVGGPWATAGSGGDYFLVDNGSSPEPLAGKCAARSAGASTTRFALLGSTAITDTEVGAALGLFAPDTDTPKQGVVARYVDTSNHLVGYVTGGPAGQGGPLRLVLAIVLSGVVTPLGAADLPPVSALNGQCALRLVVYANGAAYLTALASGGGIPLTKPIVASRSQLATGGTLASGKAGLYDFAALAISRLYDNVYVAIPASEAIVLNPGRTAQVRSDGAAREDPTGLQSGPWPVYGAYPKAPPAGAAGRITRVAARAKRNDIENAEDVPVTDRLSLQALLTPRYLVPR